MFISIKKYRGDVQNFFQIEDFFKTFYFQTKLSKNLSPLKTSKQNYKSVQPSNFF